MEQFKWRDSFTIGVAQIDQQHQAFVEYMNTLHELVTGNMHVDQSQQIIADALTRLRAYANFHFSTEETLLQEEGLQELLVEQVKQHHYFRDQIVSMEKLYHNHNLRDIQRLLEFMLEWFLTHILLQDKQYAQYFKEDGEVS